MKPVKFALVGCGRVSSRHVDALTKTPGAQLVALCDIEPNAARRYASELKIPAFASTQEMYRSVDIDVVDIATPSGDHYERVMEALIANRHVVTEKPMALRLNQADEMIQEAERRSLNFWVAFQNRYNPAVLKAKECVDQGRLGKPVIGTVRVRWCREQSYYDADNWHGTWAMDGGVLSQQAIHHLDALQWIFGEVESVESQCDTRLVKMECEDVAVATLRFKSGALGVIEAMTAARPRDIEASVSFLGEKGTVVLGGLGINRIENFEFSSPEPGDAEVSARFSQEIPNAYGFGHDALYRDVVRSVADRGPVKISGHDGRKAIELLHALYASSETGKRVWMKDQPVSSRLGIRK